MIAPCMPRCDFDSLVIPTLALYTNSIVHSIMFSRISLKPGGVVTELLIYWQDQALG